MHTRIEISKNALKNNIKSIRALLGQHTTLIAVVKANAYGHGLVQVGSAIQDDVDYLAVINLDEARELRNATIHTPIIVLGYTNEDEEDLDWAIQERVEIVANSLSHAKRLSELVSASHQTGKLRIHIKIDTGMGRMGILPENAVNYIKQINDLPGIYIKGVESHFSDAVDHREYAKKQLKKFENIKYQLFREKIEPPIWHIAKTEAILDFNESHMDAVRLGIGLYGLWPDEKLPDRVKSAHPEFKLTPALSWKTHILQVKDYPKNEFIGYGCTHKTRRKTRIAIIPVGYYEGYSRELSNKGEVLVHGRRCKVLGNICMNMCMIDVTDSAGVKRGDEAVLIGSQKNEEITADEIAGLTNTINYEVVARINPRIERIVI